MMRFSIKEILVCAIVFSLTVKGTEGVPLSQTEDTARLPEEHQDAGNPAVDEAEGSNPTAEHLETDNSKLSSSGEHENDPQPWTTNNGNKRKYNGFTVYRLWPSTHIQLDLLKELAGKVNELDFWVRPSSVGRRVDVMVPPKMNEIFHQYLDKVDLHGEVLVSDIQRLIQEEENDQIEAFSSILSLRSSKSFFADYHRTAEIHAYLDKLVEKNRTLASVMSIGKSYEHRDLKVIKIGAAGRSTKKPAIWIDGGTHAREWIAPATVLYIAAQLIENYSTDRKVKKLVDTYDWYIMPVANPDGYEYSHSRDRMWRKTRSKTTSFWGCRGVDPNRNWGFHWNQGGTSTNPCSDIYVGPRPFSEPETKAISDFILQKSERFKIFLTFHSYTQMWLTPWGWTSELPAAYNDQERRAKRAVEALAVVHGTKYDVGSSTRLLYVATGGADDWAHGVAGIKYAYTVELRDIGRFGFLLPREQIIPTGEETWEAVKTLAADIMEEQGTGTS